eukprot:Em0006g341a
MCGPYRASSIQSSDPTYCLSSILTVNITAAMNGSNVICFNTNVANSSITTVVSSTTIYVIELFELAVDMGTGNKSLLLSPLSPSRSCQDHCMGTSSDQSTRPADSDLDPSHYWWCSYQLHCHYQMTVVVLWSWLLMDHQCTPTPSLDCTDPSVPPDSSVYNISTTRGTEVTVSLQGLTSGQMYYCKAAATNTNSNNCAGPMVGGVFNFTFRLPHSDVTTPTVPDTSINGSAINDSSYDTRMMVVRCSFNQSFYCVSTDPSVPPDSSLYNISTTRGTEVTVSLQGLTSYQIYYCKAAATSTRSNNCTGVKVFFSFMTYSIPQSNLSNPGTSSHLPSIDVSTVVGITFSITFIMAFSLGVLVTICISCISKTKSKTTSSHPTTSNAPYDVVGIRQKKIDTIELKSNDAYGTVK